MKRVVITGVSGITPLGNDWSTIWEKIKGKKSGITQVKMLSEYPEMNSHLGGLAEFTLPSHFTRKMTRGMGRVAQMAVTTAYQALQDANLLDNPILTSGHTGIAFGSSSGSSKAVEDFGRFIVEKNYKKMNATTYIRMMSHTALVNISVIFGLKGLSLPTSCACASGSMAIGQAYEAIKYGKQTVMLAGGADEFSSGAVAVFDVMYATSCLNKTPELTPRPYDMNRDGLVIGEGSGCLILEEYEFAKKRGATIYAEVVGYGSNTDGVHVTNPNYETMQRCMVLALEDAQLTPKKIGYISGHGTATEHGDIAESLATENVFGYVPISSMKSYFGHTLGACGVLEAWLAIGMMNRKQFAPTLNLDVVDIKCGNLDYVMHDVRKLDCEYVMSNNFAFGGINTSLIFKKRDEHEL
ncbi:beta-ketoacyl-ACP synthase [Neisseriaceae bacterium PsAf]|nr:beta-ketoacyl-ACP synthase [Neisseriaceae bacterium PsAf]